MRTDFVALSIRAATKEAGEIDIVAEVEQHLGENRVRAVAMKPTDGIQRGMSAEDLGAPISVPVGPATLGRVLNVLGEPVDFPDRPVQATERWPIHRACERLVAGEGRAPDRERIGDLCRRLRRHRHRGRDECEQCAPHRRYVVATPPA